MSLSNIDTILEQTKDDLANAESLKQMGKTAKDKADEIYSKIHVAACVVCFCFCFLAFVYIDIPFVFTFLQTCLYTSSFLDCPSVHLFFHVFGCYARK